jgi:hypothetical protein
MFLREHPKMKLWPPIEDSLACVGPTPKLHEIPSLRLASVSHAVPARLRLNFDYGGDDCLLIRDFDDPKFFSEMRRKLERSVGLTVQQIGDLEIDF